jgi:hypothetical protein
MTVKSRISNSGLPYSMLTHYHPNYAATYVLLRLLVIKELKEDSRYTIQCTVQYIGKVQSVLRIIIKGSVGDP